MRTLTPTLLATTLALAACVSVNKSVLSTDFRARPVPASEVTVFFPEDSIPEHTRVAILNASGSESFTNEGQMIDRLREEAGKLGANAIVLGALEDPGTGERIVAGLFGGSATRDGQAVAIYVPSLDEERGREGGRW